MIINLNEINKHTDYRSLITFAHQKPVTFEVLLKKDLQKMQETDSLVYFMTAKNFRFLNICETAVNFLEKPDIYFSSYAIGNKAVVKLLDLKNQNKINAVNALLSVRTRKMNTSALNVLQTFANVKFERIHAKIFIAENKDKAITIIGSANLTNKQSNIEAGHITNNTDVSNFFKTQIL